MEALEQYREGQPAGEYTEEMRKGWWDDEQIGKFAEAIFAERGLSLDAETKEACIEAAQYAFLRFSARRGIAQDPQFLENLDDAVAYFEERGVAN